MEVREDTAVVDFGNGVLRTVYSGTAPSIKPGDIVIVHAGVIIDIVKDDKIKKFILALRSVNCAACRENLEKGYEELMEALMEIDEDFRKYSEN